MFSLKRYNLQLILALIVNKFVVSLMECPHGWKSFGDKCYILHGDRLGANLYDAHLMICPTLYEASLVSIRSLEEQIFITAYLRLDNKVRYGVWIGALRRGEHFVWLDGSALNFTNWQTGQPTNYNHTEYCAAMSMDDRELGKWHDVFCTDRYLVVCAKLAQQSPIRLSDQNHTEFETSLSEIVANESPESPESAEPELSLASGLSVIAWDLQIATVVFVALTLMTALITILVTNSCSKKRRLNRSRLAMNAFLLVCVPCVCDRYY